MRLVLRQQAKDDLRESFEWYEGRQPGLGESFRASVETALSSILAYPRMYPRVDPSVRRAATGKFPFGIFYRIDSDTIRVIAILHNSRNPLHWKRRK